MSNRVCKYLRWVVVWNPNPPLAKCHTKHVHLMPGAIQLLCNIPVVSEGGVSGGCLRKDANGLFSVHDSSLCHWFHAQRGGIQTNFWLHPHSQSQTWSETGTAEAKQTQLWWTTAVSLSGYRTPVPHREQRAGKPGLCFPWGSKRVAAGSWLRWHHGAGAAWRWAFCHQEA